MKTRSTVSPWRFLFGNGGLLVGEFNTIPLFIFARCTHWLWCITCNFMCVWVGEVIRLSYGILN